MWLTYVSVVSLISIYPTETGKGTYIKMFTWHYTIAENRNYLNLTVDQKLVTYRILTTKYYVNELENNA